MGTTVNQQPGRPAPRWLQKSFARLNVAVYRWSGGRYMNSIEGCPVCLVTMTGAKSGKQRTIPLMYVPDGEKVILVASQNGRPNNPAWHHNLIANPSIEVEVGSEKRMLQARLATAEEKKDLWEVCFSCYPPFERYRRRTSRDIPIFVCE